LNSKRFTAETQRRREKTKSFFGSPRLGRGQILNPQIVAVAFLCALCLLGVCLEEERNSSLYKSSFLSLFSASLRLCGEFTLNQENPA